MKTSFGGNWTEKKLDVLRRYLDAYTTALKKQRRFNLFYVDAFAGPGYRVREYGDFTKVHEGSPSIALQVDDKPFDMLLFIEKDKDRCRSLEGLREKYPGRNIAIRNEDANDALIYFCNKLQYSNDRAIVFLDPFATEVSWNTVERLAQTKKTDCWILFPLMAIARMMPKSREPDVKLSRQLDRIFGGREHWQNFYSESRQLPIFQDEAAVERLKGSDEIAYCYKERLESIFEKVAPTSRTFKNSKNSPLFNLFFAASNPIGAPIAVKIADHILRHW